MPSTIVFDMNETLLDLSALDAPFEEVFGDAGVRRQWFAQVLQSALVSNTLKAYSDFGVIAAAALDIIGQRHGVAIDSAARDRIMGAMRSLPPHPEVPDALERLKNEGFKLVALTNSSPPMVAAQIAAAGIEKFFDDVLSVDAVRMFKPARQVYDMAAATLGEPAGDLWMVAAHNWDTTGAIDAGWRAAFIARPGMVLGPLDHTPEIIGADLAEVADMLTAV